ncbi:ABC transporter permease [Thermoflavimicrobium daqui]|jgi:hypothetical protein|uniref:ABC3 transporter permease C-terminal domain-containing protein n=1 Tax=Thermoflavimicrobium daqui TaxID=2137476 RepID=A0A364K9Q4_9BACL|nr:ABC transporter permease [Thermoflavimicrobium daqui]RAL27025.1 hypothetical protein DL897_03030 [Thermoflavimicrobium daqui]
MNLRNLAIKNAKFQFRSYLAYFISCTFSVWMFYLYGSLLFHPMVTQKTLPNQFVSLMMVVEVMIGLFACLFIGYSQSSFLRNRKRDLGLLQCLGMSVKHITRLIFWENMLVGSLAVGVGILLGIVFSKLFFLAVSFILDLATPIPFVIPMPAILLTGIGFLLVFSVLSWWSRFTIRKLSIAELFRESVQAKPTPTFAWWKVIVSLGCLGGAYYIAWTADLASLVQRIIPIFVLVLIGTHLFFTQLSVAVISYMQKKKKLFYKGTNMMLLSQLRFRLKDNARILFIVSLLSSVVISSVSVCLTYYFEAEKVATDQSPYHLSIQGDLPNMSPAELKSLFKKEKIQVTEEVHIPLIAVQVKGEKRFVSAISQKDINRLLQKLGDPAISLQKDQAVFVNATGYTPDAEKTMAIRQMDVMMGKVNYSFKVEKELSRKFFNEHKGTHFLLVLHDTQFRELQAQAKKEELSILHNYRFDDWKQADQIVMDLDQQITKLGEDPYNVQSTYELYISLKGIFAPLMFVSLFIGILFFLAAGSILYFRIFTELPNDAGQMMVLHKLGIRQKDAIRLMSTQIRLLFFIPFIVSVCHGMAAMNMFSTLFKKPVWDLFAMAVIGYLFVFGLYYLWTHRLYMADVLKRVQKSS